MDGSSPTGSGAMPRVGLSLVLYPLAHGVLEIYSGMLSILWPVLKTKFGLSYGAVGTLSMLGRLTNTLPQLGFASVSDRSGPKWLTLIGLAWMAIGMSTVGLAPSVMVLAIILLVAPVGSASFHPAAASQVSRIFPKRRGFAIALFMIGGTLGSSLGPKLGAFLVQNYTIRATPWLMPIGVSLAVFMAVVLPANRRQMVRPSVRSSLKGIAGIPRPVFLVMAVAISQGWLEMGLQSYYPMLMTARGESLGQAATVLMLFSMFGAAGAFLGGTLSDRLPRWSVLAMGVAGTAPLYLGMMLLRGPWLLVMPAALGVVAAISHPVTVAMAQELMPDRLALASSLCMGISWVIGSLGATLTGLLADSIGMQSALLLNAALPLVSLASIALLRRRAARQAAAAQLASTGGYAEFPET